MGNMRSLKVKKSKKDKMKIQEVLVLSLSLNRVYGFVPFKRTKH